MNRRTIALFVTGLAGTSLSAIAQDTLVTILPIGGTQWKIQAEFFGAPGPGPITSIWSDASFNLGSTDGVFSNVDLNDGYDTSFLGAPIVNGEGTSLLEIRATMPGGPLLGPDNDASNPLIVATFDYTGTTAGIFSAIRNGTTRLVGQNSIFFQQAPFGAVEFYQTAQDTPGSRVLEFWVPSPGVLAPLAGLGLIAARRRRG